ncbi:cyclin [Sparassis latifolia]|uniref:Cyclin n=1 Tax=Sparassis crispa TaxID=139825 RepID=A0A401G882_9APHY|nr:cyclin [Sparassis crispa]GBE78385.1 cyclin [Sparassis crispa]
MKDVSTASKAARPSAYPKKRPSPYGISKSRKSPLYPPSLLVRRTPRAARAEMTAQRQRNAQILALRRQGIYLEEEYQDEIRAYMHEMERHTTCSITSMDQQPEIRWHMRPCLVDFLVEIHFTFRLRPETLYLALNIIDRYVSRRIVYVKHYQLVGCAALWIAAKFEDAKDRVPSIEDLVQICGKGTYDQIAFIQMEGHVLQTIQWSLGHPTAEAWLRLLCADRWLEETRVQHVARFLMEITLFYREFVRCLPSSIALGSLTLARYLCGKARRAFEETEECLEVVELLDNRLSKHVNHLSETLVRKYSFAFFSKAATLVVHYYLHGGRFVRQPSLSFPMTPVRSHSANIVSTPMSVSTTASDFSDDMPATPTSPMFSSDPFSGSCLSDDKENLPSPIFEPIIHKIPAEPIPDQFLPHDFVTLSRPALHSLNVSPRATVVA